MDPILTKFVREPHSYTLDFYLKHEGYEGLRKALGMTPNDVIEMVKASGLKGRGGARLSRRYEVAVGGQGHAEAEVHRLQRGRKRARHVQGSPADGAQPAPAVRRLPDCVSRHRREGGL